MHPVNQVVSIIYIYHSQNRNVVVTLNVGRKDATVS